MEQKLTADNGLDFDGNGDLEFTGKIWEIKTIKFKKVMCNKKYKYTKK